MASETIEHVAGEMIYVRLGDLLHSPFNVRQDDASDVTELADLIDAQTLLQNLVVVPHVGKRGKASGSPKYGVVAGGRRRRAMLLLVERGRMTLDEEVLCKLTTIELAIRASAAENSGREPLSAADTVMAFRAMVEAGASPAEVAICFGVSELTVERRLRLANVSPALFELFRSGEIDVDQMAALAISDDHEAQERVWKNTPQYNRHPANLRRLLVGADIDASSDPMAQFVGLAAYEAAGGVVKRDLFSEDGQGAIMNAELLNKLAMERLTAEAESIQREGWGWAEARPSLDYSERHRFGDAPKGQRPAKPKEQARIDALTAEESAAEVQIQALYDASDDEPDQDKVDALEKVAFKARSELQKILTKLTAWTPEVMALAGVIVTLDHAGKQVVHRGLVRPEDRKQVAKTATREADKVKALQSGGDGDAAGDEGGSDSAEAEQFSAHSEALVRKLTAHRTKALQLAISQNTHVALAALAHALLQQTVIEGIYRTSTALTIRANGCDSELSRFADDIAESPAWVELAGHLDNLRDRIPGEEERLLPWLISRPQEVLLDILAMCAALTVNTVAASESAHAGDALCAAVGLDMADWWTPTAASYLNQVPKARIVAAVTEAAGVDVGAPLAKAKKGEAVAKAEAALAGKRWLPSTLRQREVR